MKRELLDEELLWQEFCRWLGLSSEDDIQEVENLDIAYRMFMKHKREVKDMLMIKRASYRIAMENLIQ